MPANTPPPFSFDDMQEEMEADQFNDEPFVFVEDDLYEVDDMDGDDSILTYSGHSDSVFCCNFDTTGNLAVTGGQDDKALVWDTNTGVTKFTCTGHTDSVIAVAFNHDSSLVTTAGMDGLIQTWNVRTGTSVWNFDVSEITWIKWHSDSNILYSGTIDGNCWKWDFVNGGTCECFPTNGSGSACGQLYSNNSKCVVGYMDGSIRFWKTDKPSVIGAITGNDAHAANVISVACSADDNLILTGSEDGTAKLIRTANYKVVRTWNCLSINPDPDEKESVESVGFFKSHPLVATGTSSGNLKIWDISTQNQRASVNVEGPIVKLICADASPMVYIASVGDISLYDARSGDLEKIWKSPNFDILDFAVSTHTEKILAASDNFVCKIFKT